MGVALEWRRSLSCCIIDLAHISHAALSATVAVVEALTSAAAVGCREIHSMPRPSFLTPFSTSTPEKGFWAPLPLSLISFPFHTKGMMRLPNFADWHASLLSYDIDMPVSYHIALGECDFLLGCAKYDMPGCFKTS